MRRRSFLKQVTTIPTLGAVIPYVAKNDPSSEGAQSRARYTPGRIPNEYSEFLPGEREALRDSPRVRSFDEGTVTARLGDETKTLKPMDSIAGWQLLAVLPRLNGVPTAVFENHATHQGAIAYITEIGEIANVPKRVGDLSKIRPRPTNTPHKVKLDRPPYFVPGPDVCGDYILNSDEDPCYENIAALGAELIGWTLVANEEAGPERSLFLEADGRSRQIPSDPQASWAPDLPGRLFDPRRFLPSEYWYEYVPGYSKRTLLGGFLPVADIGVWNPIYQVGYEVIVVMPPGTESRPIGRVRAQLPLKPKGTLIPAGDSHADEGLPATGFLNHYWGGSAEEFFSALIGIWNRWRNFFEAGMTVEIPDDWLWDGARAGIVLSRCSYHGLQPTYQIGEGAYTKIPVRSHALFPVANYEFVWAHQLWNLTDSVEPYFQHYLDNYILANGNFLYNTQDQVEAPLNTGVFLENSARAYHYSHDLEALRKRLPVLRRMIDFVLRRYQYSKETFPAQDPRHGLIWGSPEADNGEPNNDFPESHPFYYQNAAWTWRGLKEHARCLELAGSENHDADLCQEATAIARVASDMREDIERSLARTLADRNEAMKLAGITPFSAFDTQRQPSELSSYENHRYMMDWWTSDWGDPILDAGHFLHRAVAGQQILGMNTDGDYPRTSNFMEHGTLAGRIRQDDYRPFLLALYGNMCFAMDCGNRYAPEDALLPGNYPGEGSPYAWSAVVNSELQPALGLRWLLCYEEHDRNVVHLQKAAPKHWFKPGKVIRVEDCPTRFGPVGWATTSLTRNSAMGSNQPRWQVEIHFQRPFLADLIVHVHPPNGQALHTSSVGQVRPDRVLLPSPLLREKLLMTLEIL